MKWKHSHKYLPWKGRSQSLEIGTRIQETTETNSGFIYKVTLQDFLFQEKQSIYFNP